MASDGETWAADLHVHTRNSYDSLLRPAKLVKVARKRGLSCVAVLDHGTVKGGIEARNEAPEGFTVIPGIEVRTEIGDVAGLFITEEPISTTFAELVDEVHEMCGLVLLPHPYKKADKVTKGTRNAVDLIESRNARISREANRKAAELVRRWNEPHTGGSDAHLACELGTVRTVFTEPPSDEEHLRKLLLHGDRVIVGSESPRWVHYFSAGIGNVRLGHPLKPIKKRMGGGK